MNENKVRDFLPADVPDDAPTLLDDLLPRRRVVVVVGINEYHRLPKLRRAVSDANGVARLLMDRFAFEMPIPPLLDGAATKNAIETLVEDRLRMELGPEDALVFFFAGHGTTRVNHIGQTTTKTGYLVPVEAKGRDHFGDLINVKHFLDNLGMLPANHILVILDACHSGMALDLGAAMTQHRSAATFARDLATKRSRRVITSAMGHQTALDGGPIDGHSLFTGTLINGLMQAKADTDANGIVTSSELGLYLQQTVGQSSDSAQTPDFGAFALDDRGELLLVLGESSFDNVKARAFAALQEGGLTKFKELVDQAITLQPDAAEVQYLRFRRALFEGKVDEARTCIRWLTQRWTPSARERIPLSAVDIDTLAVVLKYWGTLLSMTPGDIPLRVEVIAGRHHDKMQTCPTKQVGPIDVHSVRADEPYALRIENPTTESVYAYLIAVSPAGRLAPVRLWSGKILFNGLAPFTTEISFPFKSMELSGIEELWLYTSPVLIDGLMSPPAVGTRSELLPFYLDEVVNRVHLRKLYLLLESHCHRSGEPNLVPGRVWSERGGRDRSPGRGGALVVGLDPFDVELAEWLSAEGPFWVVHPSEHEEHETEACVGRSPDGRRWIGDAVHRCGAGGSEGEAPLAWVNGEDRQALVRGLWHYARYNLPLRLARRCRNLPSVLHMRVLDARNAGALAPDELSDPALPEVAPDPEHRYRYRLVDGDPVCFSVENRSSEPIYANLINCSASGKVEILGPTQLEIAPRQRQTFWLRGQIGCAFPCKVSAGRVSNVERLVVVGTTSRKVDLTYLRIKESFDEARRPAWTERVLQEEEPAEGWAATVVTVKIVRVTGTS